MTFTEIGLIAPILKALDALGYTKPTPIQSQSIPILLKGKDLLGCAQTGTGKTAAFAIPILQHLYNNSGQQNGKRKIKALIVTPTRELAIQIEESFEAYGKYTGLRSAVIFGGVKQGNQVDALKKGVDILIATPGRLLDLISQGFITLKDIQCFVLDEADQMLDMGFIHDIKKIIKLLPQQRQSLFFSATMAPNIVELSKQILGSPEQVTIAPEKTTAEKVEQALYYVSKTDKIKLLTHLIKTEGMHSVLVFTRTKHGADKIVKKLRQEKIEAVAIHGNKSQPQRQRALTAFKVGDVDVLIATDIAARGIDIDELSHVINYELPNVAESYVHRIGRTGRASASGNALSFCAEDERPYLKDIQKLIKQEIPVISQHPFVDATPHKPGSQQKPNKSNTQSGQGGKSSNTGKRKFHSRKKGPKNLN